MTAEQLEQAKEPDGSLIVYMTPDESGHGKLFPAAGVGRLLGKVAKLLRQIEMQQTGESRIGWLIQSMSRDEATGRLMFHLVPGGNGPMKVTKEYVEP